MIQKIREKEDPHGYLKMCEARLIGMEQLASTHITWYTHKNPYGCWICDLFLLSRTCLDTFEEFLGPDVEEKDIEMEKSTSPSEDNESYDEEDATASEGEEL